MQIIPQQNQYVEPIEKQHSGSITEALSRYRSFLINDGWKLHISNVMPSSGYLLAVKFYKIRFRLPVSLNIFCNRNQSSHKINCVTTIRITSNRGPVKQKALSNKELKHFKASDYLLETSIC